jgi:hypothetical protein
MLALFCLAWLQAAAMPCAMATGVGTSAAPEHHCPYCPPPSQTPPCHDDGAPIGCTYPDSPQVDLRGSLAAAALLPPVFSSPLELLPIALAPVLAERIEPPPASGTPLSVSYCRYLK